MVGSSVYSTIVQLYVNGESSVYIIGYCHCRFKRLTGRNEVAVSARDYKFYCPRHKHRRVNSSACSIHGLSVRPINTRFSEFKKQSDIVIFFVFIVKQTFPGMDPSTLATVSEVSTYSFQIS